MKRITQNRRKALFSFRSFSQSKYLFNQRKYLFNEKNIYDQPMHNKIHKYYINLNKRDNSNKIVTSYVSKYSNFWFPLKYLKVCFQQQVHYNNIIPAVLSSTGSPKKNDLNQGNYFSCLLLNFPVVWKLHSCRIDIYFEQFRIMQV